MNHYLTLGISMNADEETIRHAFRALARRYQPDPDRGSSVEKFRGAFEAYETFRDPLRRAAYDDSLRATYRSTRAVPVEPASTGAASRGIPSDVSSSTVAGLRRII